MDESVFQALYDKAMAGSLDDLTALSKINPTNPQYDLQIGRVFDVLQYRMNLPGSLTKEHFMSAAVSVLCLENLGAHSVGEVSASLSEGFTRVWPTFWNIIGSAFVPSLKQQKLSTEARRFARRAIAAVCSVFGQDDSTLNKMISTPGLSSLTLDIWSMEVEHPEYHPWDDKDWSSITSFLQNVFIFLSKEKNRLEDFLAPMNGDMKSLASTALKHVRLAFYRKQPNLDCVIWNIHIMATLSKTCDPIRNAFLAQHSVPAVTKILVAITAETPSPGTASLKVRAIGYALWNLLHLIQSTNGVTWVIQALEAKLMFALIRCEPWLPYEADTILVDNLYPFLNNILPNYSAYRSVLCVIEKSLTKIQQLGMDSGKSHDIPLWKAWNSFVEIAESRMEILQSAPGGQLRTHERCHNEECSRDKVRGEFRQCAACLSARYCSKACQVYDWKTGGHKDFCKKLEAQRYEGYIPDISKGDFDFIGTIIEAERVRLQDGGAFPVIFETVKQKLAIVMFDFLVCPPAKMVIPPENVDFCEHHCSESLLARWHQLRRDADTLAHPTLVFCVRLPKGQTSLPIFRVVTTTLNNGQDELVIFKGAGCSC